MSTENVETVRYVLNYTTSFAGFEVRGLDTTRRDAWVSLIHSGELTYRITEKTPQLERIHFLCSEVINTFYSLTLWAFHSGARSLGLIQEMLDENMDRTDEIKALIEATPLEGSDDDYGYGASDGYGVQAVEEGYGNASVAEDDDDESETETVEEDDTDE